MSVLEWQTGIVMRKLGAILLGFGYMVLLIESLRVSIAWWRDELGDPDPLELLLLAVLPLLTWIWWRYLSIFRRNCDKVQCALPNDRPANSSPPPKSDR